MSSPAAGSRGRPTDGTRALRVLAVEPGDVGEIITVQRAAYQSEALLYGDPALPPLTETLDELRVELERSVVLKAMLGGRIVGSVRARIENGSAHIGRLCVAPDVQGSGIGSRLLQEVEIAARDVGRFALFTGHLSRSNLRLYDQHGYHEVRRRQVSPRLTLVFLEKEA